MPTAIVAVEGLPEVMRQLDILVKDMKPMMRRMVDAGLKLVQQETQNRAPVDRGLLKRSFGRRVKQYHGGIVTVGVMGVRKGLLYLEFKNGHAVSASRYFHIQEFGSSHQPPRPFMRPAFNSVMRLMELNMTVSLQNDLYDWERAHP